jgi:cellulose synthase/poly-beta-1,6-N-acetylglucosamine synthase-like glycosyltransferase
MFTLIEFTFWICLFLVFYTYVGYGIVAWTWVQFKQLFSSPQLIPHNPDFMPSVTLVVAAYNEYDCISQKLQNSLALHYPAERLHLLFVTEGSTDGTTEFLQGQASAQIQVIGGNIRRGKVEAINHAMSYVTTPIVVFTDANTLLNHDAIKRLVRHFQDEKVGAVAGEKRVQQPFESSVTGAGEGLYWKYESALKQLDTKLYSVVGAAGELFAVRRSLYQPVEADTLLDDFVISLRIAEAGYRVVYEPAAYAIEGPSFSIKEEQKRKVRIAAGGFQAMMRLLPLLNIFKYGTLTFQYVSHRAMRWAVAPFGLVLALLLNLFLSFDSNHYLFLLALQSVFYGAAIVGYWLENQQIRFKVLYVPFYFTFMNICALLGFWKFQSGIKTGIWEKSKRAVA